MSERYSLHPLPHSVFGGGLKGESMYNNQNGRDESDSDGYDDIIHGKTYSDLFDEYMMTEMQVEDTIDFT